MAESNQSILQKAGALALRKFGYHFGTTIGTNTGRKIGNIIYLFSDKQLN